MNPQLKEQIEHKIRQSKHDDGTKKRLLFLLDTEGEALVNGQ